MQRGAGVNVGPLVKTKRIYQKGGGCTGACRSFNNFTPQAYYYHRNLQVGNGIGSVFATVGRFLLPFVQKGLSALKTHGISALQELQNDSVKNYIADQTGQLIDQMAQKGINKLKNMKGYGKKKKVVTKKKGKVKPATKTPINTKHRVKKRHSKSRIGTIKSLITKQKCKKRKKQIVKDIFNS